MYLCVFVDRLIFSPKTGCAICISQSGKHSRLNQNKTSNYLEEMSNDFLQFPLFNFKGFYNFYGCY